MMQTVVKMEECTELLCSGAHAGIHGKPHARRELCAKRHAYIVRDRDTYANLADSISLQNRTTR